MDNKNIKCIIYNIYLLQIMFITIFLLQILIHCKGNVLSTYYYNLFKLFLLSLLFSNIFLTESIQENVISVVIL